MKRYEHMRHLNAEELDALLEEERQLKWLRERSVYHTAARAKIINRATQRARAAAETATERPAKPA